MNDFQLTSSAFAQNQPIPKKYTEDGPDLSPPLAWIPPPAGTKELVLIVDDPDAPRPDPWVHWLVYKIPSDLAGLDEGASHSPIFTQRGIMEGRNTGNVNQYRGPAPPPGKVHHYHFKLYALDAPLDAQPGLTKGQLLKAMENMVLARTELIGTYKR